MTNMTKQELLSIIETMTPEELEKVAISAISKNSNAVCCETVKEEVRPRKAKTTRLNAKDVAVELTQDGKIVKFGTLPRDAYSVLKAAAEQLGGVYDKSIKGFVFTNKTNATKFAKIDKVTAEARNEIRATEWGWK